MSYGPNPWQQTQWDWRAVGNIAGGGAGGGLIVFAVLSGVQGPTLTWLLLGGVALIGAGLSCVWLEIGRPLRALNVFFNARTSWMSREAFVATLLLPLALAAATVLPALAWMAAALALGFVYCQARMLNGARGIPAWREPLTVPLLVATGLAEGAGLFWCFAAWAVQGTPVLWVAFGVLLALRFVLGVLWCRRLARGQGLRSLQAVNRAGQALSGGSLVPLVIVLFVLAAPLAPGASAALQALAGALAALGGAAFKYLLIARAGFNQGFALSHLPVRGVRR
jgi:phenylacetyl-CoA:acceptor oxidoreductase 26-kDa subunit